MIMGIMPLDDSGQGCQFPFPSGQSLLDIRSASDTSTTGRVLAASHPVRSQFFLRQIFLLSAFRLLNYCSLLGSRLKSSL